MANPEHPEAARRPGRPKADRRGQTVWIGPELSAAVGGAEGPEVTRRVQDIVRRALGLHPDGAQIPAYPDDQQR